MVKLLKTDLHLEQKKNSAEFNVRTPKYVRCVVNCSENVLLRSMSTKMAQILEAFIGDVIT